MTPAFMSNPVIATLRAATTEAHQALDRDFSAIATLSRPEARIPTLRRYLALHEAVEHAAAPHLATDPAFDWPARLRTPAILAGLATLHAPAPSAPLHPLALPSRAAALGAVYVTEGSTLGGRLILRAVQDAGADTTGLHFLDPYGPNTGQMWRGFLALLDRELAEPEALQAACAAATQTFALARACLVPAPIPVAAQ